MDWHRQWGSEASWRARRKKLVVPLYDSRDSSRCDSLVRLADFRQTRRSLSCLENRPYTRKMSGFECIGGDKINFSLSPGAPWKTFRGSMTNFVCIVDKSPNPDSLGLPMGTEDTPRRRLIPLFDLRSLGACEPADFTAVNPVGYASGPRE